MIAQPDRSVVGGRFRSSLPTLMLGFAALLAGLGGTLVATRLMTPPAPAATAAATAQYLPAVDHQPQPAPDFRLPDETGQVVSLSGLRGHEVLMTFMDPQCTAMCPIVGQEISSIEASLPANITPILLVVSVAPGRTAADVSTFVAHVTWRAGWHWLLGNQEQLQAVWATYHIAVQPSLTDVAHDETLYVIDPQGRITAGYNAPLPVGEVASVIAAHSSR